MERKRLLALQGIAFPLDLYDKFGNDLMCDLAGNAFATPAYTAVVSWRTFDVPNKNARLIFIWAQVFLCV